MGDLESSETSGQLEKSLDKTVAADSSVKAGGVVENYYEILNVEPGASRLKIREMYLRMKSTYGAGSVALYSLISEEEAEAAMRQIDQAFQVLNDDAARQRYDRQMGFDTQYGRPVGGPTDPYGVPMGGHSNQNSPNMPNQNLQQIQNMDPFDAMASQHQLERLETLRGVQPPPRKRVPIHNRVSAVQLTASQSNADDVKERFETLINEGDAGDGNLYRQLREAAGVSEDELQERTKVSRGYINDIEENCFERLPATVYVKGFLTSMLKYLAVPDCEKLVAAYAARLSEWQKTQKS